MQNTSQQTLAEFKPTKALHQEQIRSEKYTALVNWKRTLQKGNDIHSICRGCPSVRMGIITLISSKLKTISKAIQKTIASSYRITLRRCNWLCDVRYLTLCVSIILWLVAVKNSLKLQNKNKKRLKARKIYGIGHLDIPVDGFIIPSLWHFSGNHLFEFFGVWIIKNAVFLRLLIIIGFASSTASVVAVGASLIATVI